MTSNLDIDLSNLDYPRRRESISRILRKTIPLRVGYTQKPGPESTTLISTSSGLDAKHSKNPPSFVKLLKRSSIKYTQEFKLQNFHKQQEQNR